MSFSEIIAKLDSFAWGPVMLVLLVGTGIYLTVRVKFLQVTKFGYAMKNTIGKMFKKTNAGQGEITPFQAVTTALAATEVPVQCSGCGYLLFSEWLQNIPKLFSLSNTVKEMKKVTMSAVRCITLKTVSAKIGNGFQPYSVSLLFLLHLESEI